MCDTHRNYDPEGTPESADVRTVSGRRTYSKYLMEARVDYRDKEPQSDRACLGVTLCRAVRASVFGVEVPLGHYGETK